MTMKGVRFRLKRQFSKKLFDKKNTVFCLFSKFRVGQKARKMGIKQKKQADAGSRHVSKIAL